MIRANAKFLDYENAANGFTRSFASVLATAERRRAESRWRRRT